MSTVRSVSEIINILSGIIKQEVSVTGRVSGDPIYPQGVFWLMHERNKIRCFIPDGKIASFGSLLTSGNMVVVNGEITLFSRFSQYQIRVSNIQNTQVSKNTVSVTKVTNEISCLVAKTQELQDIRIQGEVLEVFSAAVSNWNLCDAGSPPGLQIKCVCSGSISSLVHVGNNVCVRGGVSIYPSQSLYQIDVTGVDPITENSREQCQCSGCDRCGSLSQCNRLRKIANFESCATCLPHPPDELYELCPECYEVNPDSEAKVVDSIYKYLNELGVNGFSPDRECYIQFGSRNGIADVALTDVNGSFAVIAECKGAGYVGHGIEQLKSYLSATDTRFGILRIEQISVNGNFMRIGEEIAFLKLIVPNLNSEWLRTSIFAHCFRMRLRTSVRKFTKS